MVHANIKCCHYHSSFHTWSEADAEFLGLISSSKFSADRSLKKVSSLVESGRRAKLDTVSCRKPTFVPLSLEKVFG
jgi:hypothetical protein